MTRTVITICLGILLISCNSVATDNNDGDGERYITLLTTTSTVDSGLLDYLNPVFTSETGIAVRVVPMGTGAALRAGKNGDGDILLVHDRESELKFISDGHGIDRHEFMYNDFVILGPDTNPAGITVDEPALSAFGKIADTESSFVSRGDDSGTHRREIRIWKDAPGTESDPSQWWSMPPGDWYRAVGQGMGASLTIADELGAYILVDRGTYLARGKELRLVILNEGDRNLRNNYAVMLVNPEDHPHVKRELAVEYIEWLTSRKGKDLIDSFTIDGKVLFHTMEGDE